MDKHTCHPTYKTAMHVCGFQLPGNMGVSVSETLDMDRGMYGGTVLKEVYVPAERTKLKDRSSVPWGWK